MRCKKVVSQLKRWLMNKTFDKFEYFGRQNTKRNKISKLILADVVNFKKIKEYFILNHNSINYFDMKSFKSVDFLCNLS